MRCRCSYPHAYNAQRSTVDLREQGRWCNAQRSTVDLRERNPITLNGRNAQRYVLTLGNEHSLQR